MESNGWITDRQPTADDADNSGLVLVFYCGTVILCSWQDVSGGDMWMRVPKPPSYVKTKWKPKEGKRYWHVGSGVEVEATYWYDTEFQRTLYSAGNCFQTKREAQEVCEKFAQLLKEHHDGK